MTHWPGEDTRRQVTQLAGLGWTLEEIADFMGLHYQTVDKHYKEEIRKGRNSTYHVATAKLYEKIKQGDYKAITFWLRVQRGWKDSMTIKHEGAVVVDNIASKLAGLTDEDLNDLERIAERLRGSTGPGDDPAGEGAAEPPQLCEGDPS